MNAKEEIQALLVRLTAAWRQQRFDELAALFDPAVVFVPPHPAPRIIGREACIDSYRQFISAVQVLAYEEDPPTIDIWDQTAVATCPWRMRWVREGQVETEAGQDVHVLIRNHGPWSIAWRTMISHTADAAG